ncbi:ribonucleoside-diphosphate reductase subunit alpha [Mesobacillus selenatarsenatis]|uniref:Ribonucleoside-diphosphate reductase n=1 Tax=Mesobacillus selenatarsenatis (strain DSM 18680 / JCM 14380 / FERM P-15431 / SF-1) TaxID=1321606 RepID=A0A0A8X6Z8_MESS1|nr:ribonucleoside-diphosphate reductase subunit alpha [Mesobacillus selenatarsenatis]GAM15745.1 ribonucleotide reductase of class Ia (aerobic), alpha subunit [Mesobacillus selenatarsenatis SF-1]
MSIQVKDENVAKLIAEIESSFPELDFQSFKEKVDQALEVKDMTDDQVENMLILTAVERISRNEPEWTYVAEGFYLKKLYKLSANFRNTKIESGYGSFYELFNSLIEIGIYDSKVLTSYSRTEIDHLEKVIDPERDKLFTYIGLVTMAERYLARTQNGDFAELPQERFMMIAMTLLAEEPKEIRLQLVEEAYWALSNLYMTVATPTLSNAGKSYGQLSSCFIDTVADDLRSIYDCNTDISTLSKNGGGIGVYLGKIRSRGSDIKGFKGVSSGVIPWMKQLNNTAVSVDQLGQRQGAIAVYLDVWHKDIFPFLDAKLNNGDERQRTHDLFTGICIPDLFMEQVEKRGDWYLFDPHEVRRIMGFSLEDYFDEEKGAGSFREKYWACVNHPGLSHEVVPAIEIFKSIMISQLETGTPYMFYRDQVNRLNANHHKGMIYCSNLCTEITQNMSPTLLEEETVQDGKILIYKKPGDFVVCNLSSISLAKSVMDDVLDRVIKIQVRMLDNVIDINDIPVLQAQITNKNYRGIGLGTFGWHHLLALKGIKWESEEAVEYCDSLYENIAFLTINASLELAKEKGAYPYFEGSDWSTGQFFEKRQYTGGSWEDLAVGVKQHGIRNGYLMAVAPNSSTSILAGSTASIDPIFRLEYSEEKKDYKIPVTAPDLSAETMWFYKTAYNTDQHWSIRQNARRQRHIDQAISFNFYVTNNIKAKALLELHMDAWKSGLKTTYYVRSTSSSEIDECESCHS